MAVEPAGLTNSAVAATPPPTSCPARTGPPPGINDDSGFDGEALGAHAVDPAGGVGREAGDLGGATNTRTERHGIRRKGLVESGARADETAARTSVDIGPGESEAHPAADEANARRAVPALGVGVGEAQRIELGDGARRHDLRVGASGAVGGAFEDENVDAGGAQVCRSSGTGWAGSDDNNVCAISSDEEQRHTLLVKVFTNTDPLYEADFRPFTKANLSGRGAGQACFVARWRATIPALRLRHATSLQPAAATRVASAFWSGQAWMDSAR